MHILVTDVLTCPRCGPAHGLILLADRIEQRRVGEGRLGCANCREAYAIHEGVADLRHRAVDAAGSAEELADDEERPLRWAALLGVAEGAGVALVADAPPEVVAAVAELLPHLEIVGVSVAPPPAALPPGVSWIVRGPELPVRDHSLRGVVASGSAAADLISEAARVLGRGARVVIDPAGAQTTQHLAEHGLSVLLDQAGVAVASAPGSG